MINRFSAFANLNSTNNVPANRTSFPTDNDKLNWKCYEIHDTLFIGWALQAHTLKSTLLGMDQNGHPDFDTTYSPLGEKIHQLKSNKSKLSENDKKNIADELANEVIHFLQGNLPPEEIDVIISTPSSKKRDFHHVNYIAEKIAHQLKRKVDLNYIKKIKETPQLKSIDDIDEKMEVLKNAFQVDTSYQGRKVLIFDDIIDNGITLTNIAAEIINTGKAQKLYFLTLTRTKKIDENRLKNYFLELTANNNNQYNENKTFCNNNFWD